ncbi:MAG: hypothetical protein EOO03_00440 [Chitinophagaceae bacterium]|nr:MAG: hypothetical protein EOO03_00440 [Chitinophagaceae bacterium]
MYFVYILYSRKLRRYYMGAADDVAERLDRHNLSRVTSARYGNP